MKKIIMYLSAFIPLLWIMIIKDYLKLLVGAINGTNYFQALLNIWLFVALGLTSMLTMAFVIMLCHNKKLSYDTVIVKKAKNRTAEYYLGYFSLFILAPLGFSLTSIVDICVLVFILIILGVVYIKNNLYFINPTINLVKGYIYEVEYDDGNIIRTRIIVSKNKIEINKTLQIEISEYDFAFAREKENESDDKK